MEISAVGKGGLRQACLGDLQKATELLAGVWRKRMSWSVYLGVCIVGSLVVVG